jgi:hypothetical protein
MALYGGGLPNGIIQTRLHINGRRRLMSDRYPRILGRALRCDRLLWSYARQRVLFTIRRPFKRALFRFASGGKDLDVVDPLHLSFRRTAGKRVVSEAQFSPGAASAVILGLGQSNIANECDPSALYEPKGNVYNFNFFDGKCYVAKDPLLGASIDRSNVLTRLGELLVEGGNYLSVMLVPIAHGGTFASEWAPGGRMFPRLQWTIERLRERKIKITHIAWQQGEAEAGGTEPNSTEWMRHFNAVAGAIRSAGVDAPIYVAQCTICCNDPTNKFARRNGRSSTPPRVFFRDRISI